MSTWILATVAVPSFQAPNSIDPDFFSPAIKRSLYFFIWPFYQMFLIFHETKTSWALHSNSHRNKKGSSGEKRGTRGKRGPRENRGPKKRKTQFSPLLVAKMSKAMITGQAVLFYFWPSIETLLRSAAPGNRKERKQNRKEGKQSGKERKHKKEKLDI